MRHRRPSSNNLRVTERRRAFPKIQLGSTEEESREPNRETAGFREFRGQVEGIFEIGQTKYVNCVPIIMDRKQGGERGKWIDADGK